MPIFMYGSDDGRNGNEGLEMGTEAAEQEEEKGGARRRGYEVVTMGEVRFPHFFGIFETDWSTNRMEVGNVYAVTSNSSAICLPASRFFFRTNAASLKVTMLLTSRLDVAIAEEFRAGGFESSNAGELRSRKVVARKAQGAERLGEDGGELVSLGGQSWADMEMVFIMDE